MSDPLKKKPLSKSRVVLGWAILVVNIIIWTALAFWWSSGRAAPATDDSYGIGFTIFMVVVAFMCFVAGIGGYLLVYFTECGTFTYTQPVWTGFKARLYAANIVVPLGVMLGLGLLISAVATPLLSRAGISGPMSYMAPLLGVLIISQIILIWVRVWAPLTPRLITKRLRARGLTNEQLATGYAVGISDPSRSSFKKFSAVEDDVGMLWFNPAQLIYWGDSDQFSVSPDQLLEIERSMDAGGTSSLSGTVHVILRVLQPDNSERRIRFHTEGQWTLGAGRASMEDLAHRIEEWRKTAAIAAARQAHV